MLQCTQRRRRAVVLDALGISTGVVLGHTNRLKEVQDDLVTTPSSLGEAATFRSQFDRAIGGRFEEPLGSEAGDDSAGGDVRDTHTSRKAGDAAHPDLIDQVRYGFYVILSSLQRMIMARFQIAGGRGAS